MNGKFTILGESGSGKTCYLLGMYNRMRNHVAGYTLIASDKSQGDMLANRYLRLNNTSLGKDRFPEITDQSANFQFRIQRATRDILSFDWIDYPGAMLEATSGRDLNASDYKSVEKSINESDVLFICIDGANLAEGGTEEKIERVTEKCAVNISPYIADLSTRLSKEGKSLPPIAFIVTKYDLCQERTNPKEVRDVIEEVFLPLFEDNDSTYVAIIPVSLGSNIRDDDYRGALKPMNIHIPILFGIKFALLGRIAYEEEKIRKASVNIQSASTTISQKYSDIEIARRKKASEEDSFFLFRSNSLIRKLADDIENSKDRINQLTAEISANQNTSEEARRQAEAYRHSLDKVENELTAINMIFANGAWQERGVKLK